MLRRRQVDRVVRDGLFKELMFSMTLKAKVGAKYLNSQEKNPADRGTGTCTGPKGEKT